jgi:hypothetical protein
MPLTLAQLANKQDVFDELKSSYGQQRKWTLDDLMYRVPSRAWLNGTQWAIGAPYTLRLGPWDKTQGDDQRLPVILYGISTEDGGEVSTIVGSIPNKPGP